MKWRAFGSSGLLIGGRPVLVKSLRLMDKLGNWRRYRISTVEDSSSPTLTNIPAWAQLAKDKEGKIGVMITGTHFRLMKVGKKGRVQPTLFVSFDALSKRAKRKLLIPLDYELFEGENMTLAKEKSDEPYYVGNKRSKSFHHSGCSRAKAILPKNRVIFYTQKEALREGYIPARLCRP